MPTDTSSVTSSATFATTDLPELILRPQTGQDQSAIDQLYHACRQDLQALPMPAETIAQLIKQQQQIQAQGVAQHYPQAQTMVLAQQGQVLARMIFNHGAHDIRLIDVMVLPMVQRRGLANKLLRYLQQLSVKHHLPLRLCVMKDNPKAIALYQACGFQVSREDYLEQQMHWQAEVVCAL